MSETVPSRSEIRDGGAIEIARIESCEIPAFIANDAAGPAVIEDIAYGDDRRQNYDLALPQTTPKALVVIVHGGGWTSGGKSLFRPTIRELATLGYAGASIAYRLASDAARAFPVGLSDVRCAIRAARAKVGVQKTILIGASAGGHLAAMVAAEPDASRYDGDCSDKSAIHVDGAILYYAPLELDHSRERYVPIMRQAVDEFLYGAKTYASEAGVDEDASDWMRRAHEATPRYAIGAHTVPMLLIQGGADTIVPPADSHDFRDALVAAGVPTLLVELPEQKHGFPVLGRKGEVAIGSCTVLRFLEQIAAL